MKEVKKVNVSVIGVLIFFCTVASGCRILNVISTLIEFIGMYGGFYLQINYLALTIVYSSEIISIGYPLALHILENEQGRLRLLASYPSDN